jgi:hypothetical protein
MINNVISTNKGRTVKWREEKSLRQTGGRDVSRTFAWRKGFLTMPQPRKPNAHAGSK